MFLGVDWESLAPIIMVVSAALTVGAGLLGLRQDNVTAEGKLTRGGRALVASLIVLGILTVVSGLADQRIADEEERVDDDVRDRQFETQVAELRRVAGNLRGVSGTLAELQGGMQSSLRTQQDLFLKADENLRLSGVLQKQAQTNTLTVLQRVFQESNRIAAERIAISVSYQCPDLGPLIEGPEVRTVTLKIQRPSVGEVSLTTGQKLSVGGGLMFHGFLGDLGAFETFPSWRGARVYIRLDGVPPAGRIITISDLTSLTDEERRRWERVDRSITCPVSVGLLLNGRQVLSGKGHLSRSSEYEFNAEFTNLRVDPARLPRWAGSDSRVAAPR